jgi:ankyrin
MLEPEHGSKAASKHKDFVQKVLTHNSNPLGVSPLTFCAINNFFDLAEVLEEHGGSIHYPGQNNNSILHYIGAHGDVDGLHFCLKKQCDINAENNQGETPIFMAILKENAHMVSEMIENGAKLDKESKNGYTPLHQAVETENEELVKIIKDRFPKRSLSKRVNPFLFFTYFSVFL